MSTVEKMKNRANELASKIMGSNCYIIIVYLLSIVFLVIFTYSIYFRRETTKKDRTLKEMEANKETVEEDNSINSIIELEASDYNNQLDISGKKLDYALIDYRVFGSFNSCCQGEVINGYVSLEALKNVISYGVRLLDFELYLKDNKVVVAAGRKNVYIKDTYNHLEIGTVLSAIKRLALRGGAGNFNSEDPLILNFRIVSNNPNIYHILEKKIMKHLSDYLADRRFGREGKTQNRDILNTKFSNLKGKVLIFVDDPNKNYIENPNFYELVNASTSSRLSLYTDYQVKNENTPEKYKNEAHTKFILSIPDVMEGVNSSWLIHHNNGVQAVMMNFGGGGFFDDNMLTYTKKFSSERKAFVLKPSSLLRTRIVVQDPIEQNPAMNPTPAPVALSAGGSQIGIQSEDGKTTSVPFGASKA